MRKFALLIKSSRRFFLMLTRKKSSVDPEPTDPYLILVCLARSSADEIGESIRSTVRKAAKLAVYEEIMINVKNHQAQATVLVDTALTCLIVRI